MVPLPRSEPQQNRARLSTAPPTPAAAAAMAAAAAAARERQQEGATSVALDISKTGLDASNTSDAHAAVDAAHATTTAVSPVTPGVASPGKENSPSRSDGGADTGAASLCDGVRSKTPPPSGCIPSTWSGGGDAAGSKRHRPPSPTTPRGGVVAHCIVLGPDGVLWSCSENSGLLQVLACFFCFVFLAFFQHVRARCAILIAHLLLCHVTATA